MSNVLRKENLIYFFLLITLIIGFYILKDYGIGIEEHFQRKSGFYWLNYLLNFTDFNSLKASTLLKLKEIEYFTPNLYPIEQVPYYGIIFDLPLAFIEVIFKIENHTEYFLLRHKAIFLIFLLSAFLFYKIILSRFNNVFLALFGFLIFIFSPRIFGNIFFDNKDILFLSIVTINFYFFLNFCKKNDLKNLILLSLFCALSSSTRIIGILIPVSFLFLIFFEYLNNNNYKKFLKTFFIFYSLFIFFSYLHWPYLWTLNFEKWLSFFNPFFQAMNPIVFFDGKFYQSKYLPLSYIPYLILITTPIFILCLFLSGIYLSFKRFFQRFLNIEEINVSNFGLWITNKEKFDTIININFLLILLLYVSINLALLSGWRHFYFVNFFIIYYSCFSINVLFLKIRKRKKILSFFKNIFIVLLLIQISSIYKYHPFQSSYFNNLVSNEKKLNFEVDTQSLSRVHAIKEIIKLKNNSVINVGTASWTPLEDARSLIPKKYWDKLNFVGTNYNNADFIYSNHYYEINYNFNKKYQIPKNFSLYKTLIIDGTRIYSIYKRD